MPPESLMWQENFYVLIGRRNIGRPREIWREQDFVPIPSQRFANLITERSIMVSSVGEAIETVGHFQDVSWRNQLTQKNSESAIRLLQVSCTERWKIFTPASVNQILLVTVPLTVTLFLRGLYNQCAFKNASLLVRSSSRILRQSYFVLNSLVQLLNNKLKTGSRTTQKMLPTFENICFDSDVPFRFLDKLEIPKIFKCSWLLIRTLRSSRNPLLALDSVFLCCSRRNVPRLSNMSRSKHVPWVLRVAIKVHTQALHWDIHPLHVVSTLHTSFLFLKWFLNLEHHLTRQSSVTAFTS